MPISPKGKLKIFPIKAGQTVKSIKFFLDLSPLGTYNKEKQSTKGKTMSRDFNKFRFEGLNYHVLSNQYWAMNRFNEEETKIVVKVADSHVFETKYGYALILDNTHVVFLKRWQVSPAPYENGYEVMLNKQFFTVKEYGNHEEFFDNEEALTFEHWLQVAKEQAEKEYEENGVACRWNRGC